VTKATILRCIEEMESKLVELRQAVEKLADGGELKSTDPLADLLQDNTEENDQGLEAVFTSLRKAWNVPPDYKLEMTLEEAQNAMAEGIPENWASREIMRMREE